MNIPRGQVIEKMTSKDKSRPVLANVYLRVGDDGATLEATDSYGLASIPVTLDDDDSRESGYVPVDALKAARKNGGRMTLAADSVTVSGVTYPRVSHGQFPNIPQLTPEYAEKIPASTVEGESYIEIGLDAEILSRLAQAVNEKGQRVRLTIKVVDGTTLRPIVVRAWDTPANTGLLMPVRIDRSVV